MCFRCIVRPRPIPKLVSAGKKGGTYPAALSAADEVAVQAFLDSKIGFTEIHKVIEQVLTEHDSQPGNTVEDFLEADRWATGRAIELTNG